MIRFAAAFTALALVAGAPLTVSAQTATAPAAARDEKPTIDWTIGKLLEDPRSAAVLEKHLPGISTHSARSQFEGMTLVEVAPYSGGLITAEIIDAIDADLKAIPEA